MLPFQSFDIFLFFIFKLASLMSILQHSYRRLYYVLFFHQLRCILYSLAIFQSPSGKKPLAWWTRCLTPFFLRKYISFEWNWQTCDCMNTDASSFVSTNWISKTPEYRRSKVSSKDSRILFFIFIHRPRPANGNGNALDFNAIKSFELDWVQFEKRRKKIVYVLSD